MNIKSDLSPGIMVEIRKFLVTLKNGYTQSGKTGKGTYELKITKK